MKAFILGASGFAGSGKDSTADILIEHANFVKVSLADPIKRIAKELYDFTDQQLWGPSQYRNEGDKRYPREDGTYLSPRLVCQLIGTQVGRECYKNTWIDKCIRISQTLIGDTNCELKYSQKLGLHKLAGVNAQTGEQPIKGVVVPDVRFQNELDAIHAAGGKVIRIVRPNAGLSGSQGMHASETEQTSIPDSAFDHVIQNTGTLDDLKLQILNWLASLTSK